MRYIPPHENKDVPIFKNIFYAIKLLLKADKYFLFWVVLGQCSYGVFQLFIQSVLFLRVLLSVIEGSGDFSYFVKMLLLFFAIGLVNEFITTYSDYATFVGQKRVFKAMNNRIIEKAADVDVACYEDPAFYDKYQRATTVLTNGYFLYFGYNLAHVIGGIISLISIVGIIASIDVTYLFFLLPVLLVFVIEIIKSKVVYKRDLEMTTNNRVKAYTQRTVFLKDFSKDMRTSNIFSVLISRFDKAIRGNVEIFKSYGLKLFLFSMVSSFFGEFIPIVGTYAFAGYQFIVTKGLEISGFSVIFSSINSVRQATTAVAENFAVMLEMALYFQNLREFFEYESEVKSGDKEAGDFESLEFRDVSFKYPGAKKESLRHLNLKINKGETVAIVGVNGAGKTTLVKLLLRFYDVTGGEILYNGVNIKEYDVKSLRNRFGTVFQDYKTFALSVNENVMCRVCSEEDKHLAKKALKRSGVYDKIKTLSKGADTMLTREFDDKGAGLSGGEAQKTAVARMFAKEFDIAILDEPSSALDPIAEYKMYENLIEATEHKTVIYISHRLSSAVLSDNIFVLGNGTVIESGSHDTLLKANGEYSKMFKLQASNYEKEGWQNA